MSASDNLSPRQFALQADGFSRWTKSEQARLTKEHEVSPGHSRFPRDVGRTMTRLSSARVDLVEQASAGVYARTNGLAQPLRDLLPDHHDLIERYENR